MFGLPSLLRGQRGFTLVELLVVIAIIGILAAVITPSAFRAVEKSKISRTIQDMTALKSAVLAFYADVGFFPADPGGAQGWHQDPGLGVRPDTVTYNVATITAMGMTEQEYRDRVNSRWQGPYLDFPLTKKTAWGGRYDYECWPELGIFVTIHEIPEASANKLAELSLFEVYYKGPDDVSSLYKVTLKVTDWIY